MVDSEKHQHSCHGVGQALQGGGHRGLVDRAGGAGDLEIKMA